MTTMETIMEVKEDGCEEVNTDEATLFCRASLKQSLLLRAMFHLHAGPLHTHANPD